MVNFARHIAPQDGTFFFTVRLADDGSDLLTRHIDLLRLSVRLCQCRYSFVIGDAVVLPDRLHAVWQMPQADQDYAARWQSIRSTFSAHLPDLPNGKRPKGIWQRRIWERPIETAADLAECRDLINEAPIRAGLVNDAADWPFFTGSRSVRRDKAGNPIHLRVVGSDG